MAGVGLFRWCFTDRRTGGITIAQRPNALLVTAMASGAASVVLPGRAGRVAAVTRDVASAAWGIDEVARGVNPWRRAIGAASLGLQLATLRRRLVRR